METLLERTEVRKGLLRNAIVETVQESRSSGCSMNNIMDNLTRNDEVGHTFNRAIVEVLVGELCSVGLVERNNKIFRWNHGRLLCGKPDAPNDLPLTEAEKNLPKCLCCGMKMRIVLPESSSMQMLGVYALVCDYCSG